MIEVVQKSLKDNLMVKTVTFRSFARGNAIASAFAAIFSVIVSAWPAEAQWLRMASNTRIAMALPEAYAPADRFSGFINRDTITSFVVQQFPGEAYDEIKTGMTTNDVALRQQGIMGAETAQLPGRDGEYLYLTGHQKTDGAEFAKFLFLTRDKDVTAMVVVNVPKNSLASGAVTRAEIEAALTSVRVQDETAPNEPLFTLGYTAGLQPLGTTLAGTTQLYTPTGRPVGDKAISTMFFVAPSLDKTSRIEALEAVARLRFQNLDPTLRAREIEHERAVEIDSLSGHEVVGSAVDSASDQKVLVYLVLLADPTGGYFVLGGMALHSEKDKYLDEFRKVAVSFDRTG